MEDIRKSLGLFKWKKEPENKKNITHAYDYCPVRPNWMSSSESEKGIKENRQHKFDKHTGDYLRSYSEIQVVFSNLHFSKNTCFS